MLRNTIEVGNPDVLVRHVLSDQVCYRLSVCPVHNNLTKMATRAPVIFPSCIVYNK